MNAVWQVLQWIAAVGEIFMGYYAVDVFVKRGILREHKRYFLIWILIIASFLAYNRHWNFSILSWGMMIILGVGMILTLINKLQAKQMFGISVIMAYNVYNALLQLLFNFAMLTWIPSTDIQTVYKDMGIYRVSCYYLAFMTEIVVLYILRKRLHSEHRIETFYKSFLFYGVAGIFLIIALQGRLVDYGKTRSSEYVFFLQIMLLASIFVLLGSIKTIETRSRLQLLDVSNRMLESNYYEMKKMYQNYAFTFHDMKNHLIILDKYCRLGEIENAIKYIEKIREPINASHHFVNSGNEAVDAVINYKLIEAEKKGIKTEVVIESLDNLCLEDYDISIIFGNLMDNAIEACGAVKEQGAWIHVLIQTVERMLLIHISNSCFIGEEKKVALHFKRNGLHGIGLESVKQVVEKYDGILKQEKKRKSFTAQVTIFDAFK